MRTSRLWISTLGRAALLVAVAAAWILLAPSRFGGQTAYVIVAGASMEPTLRQGDLVLARPSSAYDVGQIVTYNHPQVGPVIHRIIDRQGARYTLQGDANGWIDSYAPTGAEIVGGSWIVLRHAGALLTALRTPSGLAVLSLLFAALLVVTVGPRPPTTKRDSAGGIKPPTARPSDGAVFALAVLAIGSVLLGLAAFTRPTTELAPDEAAYTHTGRFAYSADAPVTVYSGGRLETGDPVYDALVPSFDVAFDYRLSAAEPAVVQGTVGLVLQVSEPNGWTRAVVLQPPTPFAGLQAHADGTVAMSTIRSMIGLLEGATALDRDGYRVDVLAQVSLVGRLAEHDLEDSFEARLPFALDNFELYLRRGDSPGGGSDDPTTTVLDGLLTVSSLQPSTLSILGAKIPVTTARAVSVAGLLLAAGSGVAWLTPYLASRRRGRAARILAEYDAMLVSITDLPASANGTIEMRAFADLARLSERTGRMILHAQSGPEHDFFLQDGETTYHLRLSEEDAGGPP